MSEPMRHACLGCGGSCQGVHVRAVDDAEAARLASVAASLGIPEAWTEGRLTRRDGACVFLEPDGRCRIHRELGPEHKPVACRQYPVVAVVTEDGPRVGIDPGCYTAIRTWRDGPSVPAGPVRAGAQRWPADAARWEADTLALIGSASDPEAALMALLGRPVQGREAVDGARRRLGAVDLGDVSYGRSVRDGLAALGATEGPPRWTGERAAWGLEATRRALWLRLHGPLGAPPGVAFLMLQGARLAATLPGGDEPYGRSLAAWSRALRAGPFVRALLGDGDGIRRWMAEEAACA